MKVTSAIKLVVIILVSVFTLAACVTLALQSVQNQAISYEEQIHTAGSDLGVQYKRRADLIPNLVECVKAYDEHEYNTLMGIVAARGQTNKGAEEIQTMISAIAEAYPELNSDKNYRELMNELATTENLIANYRTNYNLWIKNYNSYIRKFPNKQILALLGYEPIEAERLEFDASVDAPTVSFGKD